MCQEVYRGLRLNKGFKEPVPPRGCGRQGHRKFQKNMESDRKACRIPLAAWRSMPSPPGPQTAKVLGDSLVFLEEKVVGLRLLSLPVRPPCKTGRRPEGYSFIHSFVHSADICGEPATCQATFAIGCSSEQKHAISGLNINHIRSYGKHKYNK